MTEKNDDRDRLRRHLQTSQTLADSFFARREALPIYHPKRLDVPYTEMARTGQLYWQNSWNSAALLTGKPKAGSPRDTPAIATEVPRLIATMLKAMEDEWEATAVSHETSRQLLFASELLPRNVAVPEWAQAGMGSFFETPLQSPWGGTGAASFYWLPRFQEMRTRNKLERNSYETLKKVVTDGYFRDANRSGQDSDLRKARATAWSLTYFLTHEGNLTKLRAYFKELSKMPRDVELDDKVLLTAFARGMGCVKADRTIDEGALRDLATSWYNYTAALRLEADSIHQEIRKAYAKINQGAPPPQRAPAGTGPGVGPGPKGPRPGGGRPKGR
jgi:hypothetical protein